MKLFWTVILCVLLLMLGVVACTPQVGLTPDHRTTTSTDEPKIEIPYEINWNMNAMLIREDGTVVETFSLPVVGTIRKTTDGDYRYCFDLDVEFPQSVPYVMRTPGSGETPVEPEFLEMEGDWVARDYCYDADKNVPSLAMWGISIEKQYFIIYWGQDYGHFVVASLNPDIKSEEITKHFGYLMEHMKQIFADLSYLPA